MSTYTGFSWNERSMLSLAVLEPEFATPGTQVSVVWGEPEGGAKSFPWLDPHRQIEIKATSKLTLSGAQVEITSSGPLTASGKPIKLN